MVGTTLTVQFPKNPGIVLRNDNSAIVESLVAQIKDLKPQMEDDFDRDRLYWNDYYRDFDEKDVIPSDFAKAISGELLKGKSLLDLGCGNGRDSLHFLRMGLYVTGVDASDVAIKRLKGITKDNKSAIFVCDDFVKCRAVYQRQYDYIYSRFTLHAIDANQEMELLKNIIEALKQKGKLYIEARTIHDDLFGKGTKVGLNTYIYDGHFRRFIDGERLQETMRTMGYDIVSYCEGRGYSKNNGSDPVLMRLIATVRDKNIE